MTRLLSDARNAMILAAARRRREAEVLKAPGPSDAPPALSGGPDILRLAK
jgi:hypothetical protein